MCTICCLIFLEFLSVVTDVQARTRPNNGFTLKSFLTISSASYFYSNTKLIVKPSNISLSKTFIHFWLLCLCVFFNTTKNKKANTK